MLYGIGCDVCSLTHLEKSLSGAHADAFVRRVFGPAEQTALALELPLPAGRGTRRPFSRRQAPACGSRSVCGTSRPCGWKAVPRRISSPVPLQTGWLHTS